MVNVAVVVPWRDKGDPWRQANLAAVLYHLHHADIGMVEVFSDGREGAAPFNRSAAYNRGVQDSDNPDVFIFHEADMIIPPTQLRAAIHLAATSSGMIVPFDTYHYLTPEDTVRVRAGTDPRYCTPEMVMANGTSNGACNVVSAATMQAVGQWDETFEGWGFDDRAMAVAFEKATGTNTRYIPGPGVHLWHKPGWSQAWGFHGGTDVSAAEHAATKANQSRYNIYRKARTPAQVRELTSGHL